MMPNYDLGDRKLGVLPQTAMPNIRIGEMGKDVWAAGEAVSSSLNRINEVRAREAEKARLLQEKEAAKAKVVKDREDTNEANYRIAQGVDWFKNRWNGQDVKDPQTGEWHRVPGVVDRTYEELENDHTTPMDEMDRLKKEFRETDIYRTMTPDQRRQFDRSWGFKENEFFRAARDHYLNLKANHRKKQMAVEDASDDNAVMQVEASSLETFQATAEQAAARKLYRRYGSSVVSSVNPHDPQFIFEDIRFRDPNGKEADINDPRYTKAFREYQAIVQSYQTNRITNLLRVAEQDAPGADAYIAEARKTIWEMEGKDWRGEPIIYAGSKTKEGEVVSEETKIGTITELQGKALHSLVDSAEKKLKTLREQKVIKVNEKNFKERKDYLGELRLTLMDSTKTATTVLDYQAYENKLHNDPNLTDAQEQALLGKYRELEKYQKKFIADKAKYDKEVADGIAEDRAVNGYVREDGAFVPASAFAKKTDASAVVEFAESESLWSNPKSALIKVEAARMAGRLSKADYEKYRGYGEMLLEKDAETAWLKIYPKLFNIEDAQTYGYGKSELTSGEKKERKKYRDEHGEESSQYKALGGIYAKKQGYTGSSIDFLADSLEKGEEEELIPAETMVKVYRTVKRLARAGVDPEEAVRQIIAPTIESGVARDLEARIGDPDYFRDIVDKMQLETGYEDDLKANVSAQRIRKASTGARYEDESED